MSGRGVMTSRTSVSPKSTTDRSRRFSSSASVAAFSAGNAASVAGVPFWSAAGLRSTVPRKLTISAVSGLMRFATIVNSGSSSSRVRSGPRPAHDDRRDELPHHDGQQQSAAKEHDDAPDAGLHVLSQQRHAQDEQRPAHHARRDEEPHRVFEINGQDVVFALALRFEALGQPHQAREGHLDQGKEQQPGGGHENEEGVETCHETLMPGNQAGRQARARPKLLFEAAHLPTVGLVIVAQEVQEAV